MPIMSPPRGSALAVFVALPLVAMAAGWVAVRQVEKRGDGFFDRGKSIVATLEQLACAAKVLDRHKMGEFFATDYRGESLGLGSLTLADSKDGIQRLTMRSDGAERDRIAALAEWDSYLRSFDSIETAELHLHQLEDWGSGKNLRVIVRAEFIARPHGAPASGIDRSYLRMTLAENGGGLKITSASLIEGERIISERPQFREVGAQAGINLLNRYYPAFLSTPLKFQMLRYGPRRHHGRRLSTTTASTISSSPTVWSRELFRNGATGTFEDITAKAGLAGLDGVSVALFADYDNDGYKDLFVSRTFKPQPTVPQQRRRHVHGRDRKVRNRRRLLHHGCVVGGLRQRRPAGPLRRPLSRSAHAASRRRSTRATASRTSSTTTTATAPSPTSPEKAGVGDTGPLPRHGVGRLRQRRLSRPLRGQRLRTQDALPQQPQRHVYRCDRAKPARSTTARA